MWGPRAEVQSMDGWPAVCEQCSGQGSPGGTCVLERTVSSGSASLSFSGFKHLPPSRPDLEGPKPVWGLSCPSASSPTLPLPPVPLPTPVSNLSLVIKRKDFLLRTVLFKIAGLRPLMNCEMDLRVLARF